jgi:predicted permease
MNWWKRANRTFRPWPELILSATGLIFLSLAALIGHSHTRWLPHPAILGWGLVITTFLGLFAVNAALPSHYFQNRAHLYNPELRARHIPIVVIGLVGFVLFGLAIEYAFKRLFGEKTSQDLRQIWGFGIPWLTLRAFLLLGGFRGQTTGSPRHEVGE